MTNITQEFLAHVERFRKSDVLTDEQLRRNFHLGLLCEIGELGDVFKKHYFYGDPLDVEKVKSEAGDVLYYLVALLQVQNLPFDIPDESLIKECFDDSANLSLPKEDCIETAVELLLVKAIELVSFARTMQRVESRGFVRHAGTTDTLQNMVFDVFTGVAFLIKDICSIEDCMLANMSKLRERHEGTAFNREKQRRNKQQELQIEDKQDG